MSMRTRSRTRRFERDLWAAWVGVLAIFIFWQLSSSLELINPAIFPGPIEVLRTTFELMPLSRLLQHIETSLLRIASGFLIGALTGIFLGIASGWYRTLGHIIRTPIELTRPIPPLAWIGLALIWFGRGEASKLFIIAMGAFYPVVTNTYKGMVNTDPDLLRAGQMLGLRGLKLLFRVALPASLPDIAVGLRIGWSFSFGTMIAAEIIAASSGLGYMVMNARFQGWFGVIIFGIFLIGSLNLLTDFLIREFILKRRLSWHFGGLQNA